jgi:hypothetical protein
MLKYSILNGRLQARDAGTVSGPSSPLLDVQVELDQYEYFKDTSVAATTHGSQTVVRVQPFSLTFRPH